MSDLYSLKKAVYEANVRLFKSGLAVLTWGNVSAIDREKGLVVIKPSGVDYAELKPENMAVVDLCGNVAEGSMRPSSDTPTHLELYSAFADVGAIVHTHSPFATAFAQAKRPIIPYGTTHADCFYGEVPLTRELTGEELAEYEKNTGKAIIEAFAGKDPASIPAALVASHGPFAWGKSPAGAVDNAITLEEVAKMAYYTLALSPEAARLGQHILDKHYFRKHGANAYYGQGDHK